MRKAQVERMKKVNELIEVIASIDNRFFYTDKYDRVAKFVEGKTTTLWFEEYTGKIISITDENRNKFTHGGTLWRLVNDFKLWILTGDYEEKGYWGLNSIRHWGYSDDGVAKVMAKGREIGFVKEGVQ